MNINKFSIYGVNKLYNYNMSIKDNTLILVGENGTGKSTVLAIFKHVLARDWEQLFLYDFVSLVIEIDNKKYNLTHKNVLNGSFDSSYYNLSAHSETIFNDEEVFIEDDFFRNENILADEYIYNSEDGFIERSILDDEILMGNEEGFPGRDVSEGEVFSTVWYNGRHEQKNYIDRHYNLHQKKINSLMKKQMESKQKNLTEMKLIENVLAKIRPEQIIYLPTYRRIERDLDTILISSGLRGGAFAKLTNHFNNKKQKNNMIEFGMKDIKEILTKEMDRISSDFRNGMKQFMLGYTQDIFTKKHEGGDYNINHINSKKIDDILIKIDNDTLTPEIKKALKRNILDLRGQKSHNDVDKVMRYFIFRLNNFYEEQVKNEDNIKKFIVTCNKYLVNKEIVFDSVSYEVKILDKERKKSKIKIELESLSSGEKQIISLFAHLSISKTNGYIIIIDEPELSLSVMWQYTFLEDIKKIGDCKGLFAVTHSPFIYENSLDGYACSIGEFSEVYK
ncbi:AAA family ATPase [Pectobacterium carotovorum]|uniref:AAA family ATPase n=1 Tax=Pectobacterium carotovorum TaxID=554 RepID=UPI003D9B81F2